jgi:hypothetical protein
MAAASEQGLGLDMQREGGFGFLSPPAVEFG